MASEIVFDGRRAVGVKATVAGEAREFARARSSCAAGGIQSPDAAAALRHRARGALARRSASRCAPTCPASGRTCRTIRCCSSARICARRRASRADAAHPAGDELPPLVRPARLPEDRSLHQPAEQVVVERARRADRQSRPGAVEAVFARAGHARRRSDCRHPLVEFNFVADERDLARLKYGFRFVVDLLASDAHARAHRPAVSGALHRPAAPAEPEDAPRTPGSPRSSRGCSISARRSATTASRS